MIKEITAIHVDDDERSITMFKIAASKVPGLLLQASFTNTKDVLRYLDNNVVDILFSDIEMPDGDGLWLADQLSQENLDVVFVSAHAGYALKAFEACALDYLMKPVELSRLEQVVKRKQSRLVTVPQNPQEQLREVFQHYMVDKSVPLKVFVQVESDLHVIILEDVIYFGASGAYTKVVLRSGRTLLSYKAFKTYEDALHYHPDFVRIHRSYMVNKNAVQVVHREERAFAVTMNNGDRLEMSYRRKDDVIPRLKK